MKKLSYLYVYILYPVYTCWFASHSSIINENLSHVGNLKGMRIHFILWALMCVLALSIGLKTCIRKCYHDRSIRFIITLSCLLFLTSVLLPYLPEFYPFMSQMHESMAFIGLVVLLIGCAYMVIDLKMNYSIYPYDIILIGIYGIALGIYGSHYMSVNSLVEIFLGMVMPIYLIHLGEKLS